MRIYVIALLLAATSCTAPPVAYSSVPKEEFFRRTKREPPSAWKKIAIEGKFIGYLEDRWQPLEDGGHRATYWIYDKDFRNLGFFTEGGSTVRVSDLGLSEPLGVESRERAILLIFRVPIEAKGLEEEVLRLPRVDLLPMERPWEVGREPEKTAPK